MLAGRASVVLCLVSLWLCDASESQPFEVETYGRFLRDLQREHETNKGRTVLTFLYLSVLGLCFLTPVLYYCRLHWEERAVRRRLRDLEAQGLETALSQSSENLDNALGSSANTEESRAARRKYIEERRARIVQLFAPVRLVLTSDNFPKGGSPMQQIKQGEDEDIAKEDEIAAKDEGEMKTTGDTSEHDLETGEDLDPNGDDENMVIEIPVSGLHLNSLSQPVEKPPTRLASGTCTICLSAFEVGSDVVWSSNEHCDHVFHEECIEKWLLKQREGPLCPCCRRDFIVDPFDVDDQNDNAGDGNNSEEPPAPNQNSSSSSVSPTADASMHNTLSQNASD